MKNDRNKDAESAQLAAGQDEIKEVDERDGQNSSYNDPDTYISDTETVVPQDEPYRDLYCENDAMAQLAIAAGYLDKAPLGTDSVKAEGSSLREQSENTHASSGSGNRLGHSQFAHWMTTNSSDDEAITHLEQDRTFHRYQNWPKEVRERILSHYVPVDQTIRPYYNEGSVSAPVTCNSNANFDLSTLFIGNRQFFEDASSVFYGMNVFTFTEPKIALWWVRRIGQSLKKVRRAHFRLSEGVSDHHTNCTETRLEKYWSILFHWLEKRQNLTEIVVTLRGWRASGESGVSLIAQAQYAPPLARMSGLSFASRASTALRHPRPDLSSQYLNIDKARDEALMCLFRWRGLQIAIIEGGSYLPTSPMCKLIERAMKLDKGETNEEIEWATQCYEASLVTAGREAKRYVMR